MAENFFLVKGEQPCQIEFYHICTYHCSVRKQIHGYKRYEMTSSKQLKYKFKMKKYIILYSLASCGQGDKAPFITLQIREVQQYP